MPEEFFGEPMKDLRGFIKPEETQALIQVAGNERNELLFETLWATGGRISEVVGKYDKKEKIVKWGITPRDVLRDEPVLIMRTLKRKLARINKETGEVTKLEPPLRRVPIKRSLWVALLGYIDLHKIAPDERIFPITRQRADQIIKDCAGRAGITKIGNKKPHAHHFRHGHCVQWIRKDNTMEGLRKLQERLKHSSITTTAHYLQFGPTRKEKDIVEAF